MADKKRTALDWEDVRYFVALARYGTLSATARGLRVNHATVARRVTSLEALLGRSLFDRRVDGYALTAEGKAVLDAAQSVPHLPVDVQALDADFICFSGHKMLGPTGIGVLYGKRDILEAMPPFMGGGDMIRKVGLRESSWNDLPWKFEAGTPAIAEAIGLGAAVDYLNVLGMQNVLRHEQEITHYAMQQLQNVQGLTIYGPDAAQRGGVISFTLGDIHPHDLASILDQEVGVAVRAGHHCAQPLMRRLGVAATTRASFAVHNSSADIDRLLEGLAEVRRVLQL